MHRQEEWNLVCCCTILHKKQMKTKNFPRWTQCLSAEPPSDTTLGRVLFVWFRASFRDWAVLIERKIVPAWSSITCSEEFIENDASRCLQAWIPSTHVWLKCVSPASPQFLNQAPPRAQQLYLPTLLLAHLAHPSLLLKAGVLIFTAASTGESRCQHNVKITAVDIAITV